MVGARWHTDEHRSRGATRDHGVIADTNLAPGRCQLTGLGGFPISQVGVACWATRVTRNDIAAMVAQPSRPVTSPSPGAESEQAVQQRRLRTGERPDRGDRDRRAAWRRAL